MVNARVRGGLLWEGMGCSQEVEEALLRCAVRTDPGEWVRPERVPSEGVGVSARGKALGGFVDLCHLRCMSLRAQLPHRGQEGACSVLCDHPC